MLRKVSEEIIGKINYFMIYQAFDCSFLQKKKNPLLHLQGVLVIFKDMLHLKLLNIYVPDSLDLSPLFGGAKWLFCSAALRKPGLLAPAG